MDKVRFGIVGCGNMGVGHANFYHNGEIKNGVLTAVCDINPAKFEYLKIGTFSLFFNGILLSGANILTVWVCIPHKTQLLYLKKKKSYFHKKILNTEIADKTCLG